MIAFDSYAWLEFFAGSEKGKIVARYIESKEEILTPAVCLAEIKRRYLKDKKDYIKRIQFISARSKIIQIDSKIALLSADLSDNFKLYMIDALVYACALITKSKLLTGDQHFKNLENVEML
jgi:predicted nucleic acid-binding protein